MTKKKQIQYFVPSIPVVFMISVSDKDKSTFFKHTHMPAVPRAGDRLSIIVNMEEYGVVVEGVEYIEEDHRYEVDLIDLEDVSIEEVLSNFNEDPDWH